MVDKRLTARLIKSAALLADYPGRAITGTAKSDAAAVDGYYRFIEQPADSQVTVESILAPHRARSVQRMRSQDTVLCLQDGSDLNFATRPGCAGLGIIGRNQTKNPGSASSCDARGEPARASSGRAALRLRPRRQG